MPSAASGGAAGRPKGRRERACTAAAWAATSARPDRAQAAHTPRAEATGGDAAAQKMQRDTVAPSPAPPRARLCRRGARGTGMPLGIPHLMNIGRAAASCRDRPGARPSRHAPAGACHWAMA